MHEEGFEFISRMLKERSGLVVTRDKTYLLESRLLPVARKYGFKSLPEFIRCMREMPNEKAMHAVVDAMTNNESMFFRDKKPFEQLSRLVLPRIRSERPQGGKLRIWSAACSTGQEPYSIGICLCEEASSIPEFGFEVIATDISMRVLEKARQGIYSQFEVQRGVPEWLLPKYFNRLPDGNWQVGDALACIVEFMQQNLIEDITIPGMFDIIFCRNVLIYFNEGTRRAILEKITRKLNPGGALLMGSAENINGFSGRYNTFPDEHGLYIFRG